MVLLWGNGSVGNEIWYEVLNVGNSYMGILCMGDGGIGVRDDVIILFLFYWILVFV